MRGGGLWSVKECISVMMVKVRQWRDSGDGEK